MKRPYEHLAGGPTCVHVNILPSACYMRFVEGSALQSQMLDFETARGERLILDLDAKEKVRRNRVDWTWKGAPGGLVFEVDRTIE